MVDRRSNPLKQFDMDRDGKVTEKDIDGVSDILELKLREEKAASQKRMAWVALVSMLIFTIALFSPLVTDSRVTALADLLGLFYIAQAGVVGAYMGVTAWMSNKSRSRFDTFDDIDGSDNTWWRRRMRTDRPTQTGKSKPDPADDVVRGNE